MSTRRTCFVIAPIGEPESDARKRSDQILNYVITPAVSQCGYDPIRADQISEPGIITSQVIHHIVEDPLVIADLTDRNPNVFYELAIRHAIRKPLVQLIRKGEPLPFDVAGTRTISVDHRDLDSVEAAKRDIVSQVKALEHNLQDIETPISVSLDLQLLRQSENPEQRSLADILSAISELRSSIAAIESKVSEMNAQSSSSSTKYVIVPSLTQDSASPTVKHLLWHQYNDPDWDLNLDLSPAQQSALLNALNQLLHRSERTSPKQIKKEEQGGESRELGKLKREDKSQ